MSTPATPNPADAGTTGKKINLAGAAGAVSSGVTTAVTGLLATGQITKKEVVIPTVILAAVTAFLGWLFPTWKHN